MIYVIDHGFSLPKNNEQLEKIREELEKIEQRRLREDLARIDWRQDYNYLHSQPRPSLPTPRSLGLPESTGEGQHPALEDTTPSRHSHLEALREFEKMDELTRELEKPVEPLSPPKPKPEPEKPPTIWDHVLDEDFMDLG